mgnify:CR=1 FL=1
MSDNTNKTDQTFKILSDLIDEVFSNHYNKDKKMQVEPMKSPVVEQTTTQVYESIEDYTAQTGKRFRMTKDQKQRNLSRDEAFNETFGGKN